jgi:hypothetical protein
MRYEARATAIADVVLRCLEAANMGKGKVWRRLGLQTRGANERPALATLRKIAILQYSMCTSQHGNMLLRKNSRAFRLSHEATLELPLLPPDFALDLTRACQHSQSFMRSEASSPLQG